jgi:hypothetical protein
MHNGTPQAEHLEAQIDAVKDSLKKLIESLDGKPDRAPRVQAFAGKLTAAIRAYPVTAVAVALGLGYLAVRIVRR